MGFLNKDENGVYTAARDDGTGLPVTDVHVQGTQLVQQFTEADEVDGKLTFTKQLKSIGIFNRATTDGVFNVNGFDIHVPAGTNADFRVGGTPSNIVKVSNSDKYIVSRFE
ncbi:hypothetical protein FZC83_02390 [Rossellomorea marisflavi]|uniref:Uncharacterized protein n=1 Tax=Rossellomorea marisflavi TaxID=189381 RepID=A0A5D4RYH7_9BACI|nr:hypothetical protein [Rossellomorea marisflavi]TYS56443.1 hypothetical protein FZC83_02390 [Rossellomorea marisflavi]